MLKIKRTENMLKQDFNNLQEEIKDRIRIVFQKDLNNIPYEKVKEHFAYKSQFEIMKINMLLLADKILTIISNKHIKNHNYKAFTALGLYTMLGKHMTTKNIHSKSNSEC